MKTKRVLSILAFSVLPLFAAQKHETKIDSMVYETGAEYRIYSTAAPVKSFCVQKDLLWYVTEKGAGWMTMSSKKKSDQQDFADVSGITGADMTCCVIDASNVAWVGTKSGLAMRTKDTSKDLFKLFTKENGLPDNAVNKLLAVRGGLWVATDNGAALYQGGTWKSYSSKDGLAGNMVHDMAAGAGNAVWFGTNKGISCFDGGKWMTFTMKNGLSWNDTKALAFDPKTSTLWAAVGEKDINCYDGNAWKVFMEVADGATALMADTHSRIWLAYGGGLMKFNGDEWVSDPQKVGITAAQVSQMFRDDKGNLWFGMEKGVLKLDNPYPY
jgi:ligand-binding sensor domain-containing protein